MGKKEDKNLLNALNSIEKHFEGKIQMGKNNILEYKEKTIFEVEYSHLEEIAKKIYKQDICLVSSQEWDNYSLHSLIVKKGDWYEEWKEVFDKWEKTGKQSYGIFYGLMQDLCNKELIPEGEYIIDVYW